MGKQAVRSTSPRPRSRAESEQGRGAKQTKFLQAFRNTGIVSGAVGKTRISRSTHSAWLATDSTYAAKFKDVKKDVNEELADELEEELRRLALEGFDEPVFHKGERVSSIRKRSEPALFLLLKAKRPELFLNPVDERSKVDKLMDEISPDLTNKLATEDLVELRRIYAKMLTPIEEER